MIKICFLCVLMADDEVATWSNHSAPSTGSKQMQTLSLKTNNTLNNCFQLFVITGVSSCVATVLYVLVSGGYKINWRFMSTCCCFPFFKKKKRGARS